MFRNEIAQQMREDDADALWLQRRILGYLERDPEIRLRLEPGQYWVVSIRKDTFPIAVVNVSQQVRYPTTEEWAKILSAFKKQSASKATLEVLQAGQPQPFSKLQSTIGRYPDKNAINHKLGVKFRKSVYFRVRPNPGNRYAYKERLAEIVVLEPFKD